MTTKELVNELNKKGYVASLFYYDNYKVEGSANPTIEAVQFCLDNEYYDEMEDKFCDVLIEIHEDIELHFDEDF